LSDDLEKNNLSGDENEGAGSGETQKEEKVGSVEEKLDENIAKTMRSMDEISGDAAPGKKEKKEKAKEKEKARAKEREEAKAKEKAKEEEAKAKAKAKAKEEEAKAKAKAKEKEKAKEEEAKASAKAKKEEKEKARVKTSKSPDSEASAHLLKRAGRILAYAAGVLIFLIAAVFIYGETIGTEAKLEEVDVNDHVEDVSVDLGTGQEEIMNRLTRVMVVKADDGSRETVDLDWEIEDYDPETPGTYEAVGRFDFDGETDQNEVRTNIRVEVAGIDEVDVNEEVEDLSVYMGEDKENILEQFPEEIVVRDEGGKEHTVSPEWKIEDYDPQSAGSYEAVGELSLDDLTDEEYYVDATVTVVAAGLDSVDIYNSVRNISVDYGTSVHEVRRRLADNMVVRDEAGDDHTVGLSWDLDNYDSDTAGSYRVEGSFELDGEADDDYVVHSYITVGSPGISVVDVNNDVSDVSVEYGTPESTAINELTDSLVVRDEGGSEHRVSLSWDIRGYDGSSAGSYNAYARFSFRGETETVTASIVVEEEQFGEVDIHDEVEDVRVEHGTTYGKAVNELAGNMTLADEEGEEHQVNLDWSIAGYQPEPDDDTTFDATAEFDDRGINLREDTVEASVTVEGFEEVVNEEYIRTPYQEYEWRRGTDFTEPHGVDIVTDREIEAVYLWSEVGDNWLEVMGPGPNVPPAVTSEDVQVVDGQLVISTNAMWVLEEVVQSLTRSIENQEPIVHHIQFEGMEGPRHESDPTLPERTVQWSTQVVEPDEPEEPEELVDSDYISPTYQEYEWEMRSEFTEDVSTELLTDKELEAVYLWSVVGDNWLEVKGPNTGPVGRVPPDVYEDCVQVVNGRLRISTNAMRVLERVANSFSNSKRDGEPIILHLQFEGMEGPESPTDQALPDNTVQWRHQVVAP